MSLICPQCSQVAQESTVFCRGCGYRFPNNEQDVSAEATIRPVSLASLSADADPSDTLKPGSSPIAAQPTPVMVTPQPQMQIANNGPVYKQPDAAQSQNSFAPQPAPFPQGNYQVQQQPVYGQYPGQGGYGTPAAQQGPGTLATLQRGFAGKGTPVHHQSWLLERKQVHPQTLNSAFVSKLQAQQVMGVTVEPARLREQGAALEERDYIRVRYGTSSIFVYLAPMGQNLYISRTSTIQQPYSKIRMAVLIALAVLMLLSLLLYAVINPAFDPITGNPGAYGFVETLKIFFEYAFLGLLFFFITAALRSLVFWLTDQDFLAMLLPNRLSDFSLDALASIEQTTDKALRATLQEAGLDVEAIQPQHITPQQPLHRF